jgi:hypothetical protein
VQKKISVLYADSHAFEKKKPVIKWNSSLVVLHAHNLSVQGPSAGPCHRDIRLQAAERDEKDDDSKVELFKVLLYRKAAKIAPAIPRPRPAGAAVAMAAAPVEVAAAPDSVEVASEVPEEESDSVLEGPSVAVPLGPLLVAEPVLDESEPEPEAEPEAELESPVGVLLPGEVTVTETEGPVGKVTKVEPEPAGSVTRVGSSSSGSA